MFGLEEIDNIDVVNRSCTNEIPGTILCVVVIFLVGGTGKSNTRTFSKLQGSLYFRTIHVVFQMSNILYKAVVKNFATHIQNRYTRIFDGQKALERVQRSEIASFENFFMFDITMTNFGNIIKCIFELTCSIMPFPIVLINQHSYAENGKYDQKVDQNPVSKSTFYNHRLLFKFY